jgi:hypothetical protein
MNHWFPGSYVAQVEARLTKFDFCGTSADLECRNGRLRALHRGSQAPGIAQAPDPELYLARPGRHLPNRD